MPKPSELFGIQIVPSTSAKEFLDRLSPGGDHIDDELRSGIIFRGQMDASHTLQPTIFRNRQFKGPPPPSWQKQGYPQSSLVLTELYLLWQFIDKADRAGLPVPSDSHELRVLLYGDLKRLMDDPELHALPQWPRNEYLFPMALARHHGIPSRLIDWSRSHLVASYFAAFEWPSVMRNNQVPTADRQLAVWALDTNLLEVDRAWAHRRGADSQFNRTIKLVLTPYAGNPNLRGQKGLFTVSQISQIVSKDPPDNSGLELQMSRYIGRYKDRNEREYFDPFITKFTLPVAEAPSLLRLLALEGTTPEHLFPGYDSVVRAILEEQSRQAKPKA